MMAFLKKLLELACVSNPEPGVYVIDLGVSNHLDYAGAGADQGQLHSQPLELVFTVVEDTAGHSIVGAHIDYRYSTTTPQGGKGIAQSTLEPYIFGLIDSRTNGMLTASTGNSTVEAVPQLVERKEGYEDYWRHTLLLTISNT